MNFASLLPDIPNTPTRRKWYLRGLFQAFTLSLILVFFENLIPILIGFFFPYANLPTWLSIFLAFLIGFVILLLLNAIRALIPDHTPGEDRKICSKWFSEGYAVGSFPLFFEIMRNVIRTTISGLNDLGFWVAIVVSIVVFVGISGNVLGKIGELIDSMIERFSN